MIKRFLNYLTFDTGSDANSPTCPSTRGQFKLAEYLVEELKALNLVYVIIDKNGYVMATLPENTTKNVPVVGFISHMDTSSDVSGANVKPRIEKKYAGGDIMLNETEQIILSPNSFPELKRYVGEDVIVTDGTTLLGADDKAGIAEIITAVEYLLNHPELEHGPVKIAFTPDEEINRGADLFDVAKFGADFAYTVDGGAVGDMQYETFNAAKVVLHIKGCNVHPGKSKNKMKNSLLIAMELNGMLPAAEIPAHTEGYEGFFHLNGMHGNVEECTLEYIIRDHDMSRFLKRKDRMKKVVDYLNERYGESTVDLDMKDQYFNMREKIEPVMHIVELVKQAMISEGIEPHIGPVRGGTDGCRLSYMGLPCPNFFTGGHNAHSKFEFIPVSSMTKASKVIVRIVAAAALSGK